MDGNFFNSVSLYNVMLYNAIFIGYVTLSDALADGVDTILVIIVYPGYTRAAVYSEITKWVNCVIS